MCVDLELRMGSSEVTAGEGTEQNKIKSIQILNGTGIDWREGRLNCNLYMDQSVKKRLGPGERQEVSRLKEELDKNDVCHQFYSNCTANVLPSRPLKGWKALKNEDK
jgi:hypothetical protein